MMAQSRTVLEILFNNKSLSDLEIIVDGNDEKAVFYGNRAILAAKSDVFKQMFYGDNSMIESSLDGDLIIKDMTKVAFESFMKGVYELDFKITDSVVAELWYASKKYMLHSLERKCGNHVANIKNVDAFITVLTSVHNVGLIDDLMVILKQNLDIFALGVQILNHPVFLKLHKKIVIALISNDYVLVDEQTVWERCVLWSKDYENRMKMKEDSDAKTDHDWKSSMKLFVPFIRFNALNIDYFLEKVASTGILSDREQKEIAFKFLKPSYKTGFYHQNRMRWSNYVAHGPLFILNTLESYQNPDVGWKINGIDGNFVWSNMIWKYPGKYTLSFQIEKICKHKAIYGGILAWNPNEFTTSRPTASGLHPYHLTVHTPSIAEYEVWLDFSLFTIKLRKKDDPSAYGTPQMQIRQTLKTGYPFIGVCNKPECKNRNQILIQQALDIET